MRWIACSLVFLLYGVSAIAVPNLEGFIENRGQFPTTVRFYASYPGGIFYISDNGYGYVLWDHRHPTQRIRTLTIPAVRIAIEAAQNTASTNIEATQQLHAHLNIYRAHRLIEGIRVFSQVKIRNLCPGVDAIFTYRPQQRIKCDYVVHPWADKQGVQLLIRAAQPHVDESGGLVLVTSLGEFRENAPVSFAGGRAVSTRYALSGNMLSFTFDGAISSMDTLIIDPEIEWSTFFGGSTTDQIAHVRTDKQQNIIVLGRTQSADFPTKLGLSTVYGGDYDAFVAKFSPNGQLLWATYYGGSRREIHNLDHCDLAIDPRGTILITGCTQSDDLPITSAAFQRSKNSSLPSGYDIFIAELSSTGQLLWASYCGGNDNEDVFGITCDRQGNVYIAGHTSSDVIPVTTPRTPVAAPKPSPSQDVFILKLSSQRHPLWVSFIGGNRIEVATDILTDAAGGIYVCGYTLSPDFPTVGPNVYQSIKTAAHDGFLLKLDGLGRLQWSTLLGGNGEDYCTCLALDSSFERRILVGGMTNSTDLWYRGSEGRFLQGNTDGFLAAFTAQSGVAQWVQYHGGTSFDEVTAIAVDPTNHLIAVGRTLGNYPVRAPLQSEYRGGGGDMFIAKLTPTGLTQWATYAGGTFLDRATDVAIQGSANVVVVGYSGSPDFPIVGNTEQSRLANPPGTDDGIILTVCNVTIPSAQMTGSPQYCQGESRHIAVLYGNLRARYDSYQWEINGSIIPDATDDVFVLPPTLEPGTYRIVCRVANAVGCPALTDTIVVQIYPPPTIEERRFVICAGEPIRLDSIGVHGTSPFRYQWQGDPLPDDPTAPNPIVHPQQTTTYTLRVTDANGCSAERRFTVHVLPISQLPITVEGQTSFCEGDSTILVVHGNFTAVRWNTGLIGTQLIVHTSGAYYAVLSMPGGCEGYTDTVSIYVRPQPRPTLLYDGSIINVIGQYQQYQWLYDGVPIPGATNSTIVPSQSGLYAVIVDSLGCTGQSAPLQITLSATSHLTVESATVAIGDTVFIPLRLSTTTKLFAVGAQWLRVYIRYNAAVLHWLGEPHYPTFRVEEYRRGAHYTAQLQLLINDLEHDTIACLRFVALWGNATSTMIEIDSVKWNTDFVTTTWTNGIVTVTGHCTAKTIRLFEDTEEFGIRSIIPHPITDQATITFAAIEDAYHALHLVSTDGRLYQLFEGNLHKGVYAMVYDFGWLPQGYYWLALRSTSLRTMQPVLLLR